MLALANFKNSHYCFHVMGKALSSKLSCTGTGLVETILVTMLGVPLFSIFTEAYLRLHVGPYLLCLTYVDTDIERFL